MPKPDERPFELNVRIRLMEGGDIAYGKGVNQLLLLCRRHRSLHKAANAMQMSYRKALYIIKRAETCFGQPLLKKTIGGKHGGGSELTDFGERLVHGFTQVEKDTQSYVGQRLKVLLESGGKDVAGTANGQDGPP